MVMFWLFGTWPGWVGVILQQDDVVGLKLFGVVALRFLWPKLLKPHDGSFTF